jgi:hypothetical protein
MRCHFPEIITIPSKSALREWGAFLSPIESTFEKEMSNLDHQCATSADGPWLPISMASSLYFTAMP